MTEPVSGQPAEPPHVRDWLVHMCTEHADRLPGLRGWAMDPDRDRAAVVFDLEPQSVELRARRPDDEPCWLSSAQVAFNVECHPEPAPRKVQLFLRALRSILERASPGEMVFPRRRAANARRPRRAPGRAVKERIRRAAFYVAKLIDKDPRVMPPIQRHDGVEASSWRTLVLQEFYPYVGALGRPTPEAEILDGWRATAARIRDGRAPNQTGLYIHFPFCAVRCRFCYCAMTDNLEKGAVSRYLTTLMADMRRYGAILDGTAISTVFIGGGTPSLMRVGQLEEFFATMHECFHIPETTQITVETNPDSLGEKKLDVLRRVGRATRITIGVQTLDPEAQRRAKRFNKAEKVRALVEAAHERGMLVNMDLMTGMDGQSFESFQKDARFVLSLEPDSLHLSGFRPVRHDGGDMTLDHEQVERRRQMSEWGAALLREHGIEPRLGMPPSRDEAAVNEQIVEWRDFNASLLGLGVSAYAHSFGSHFYETSRDYETSAGIDASLVQFGRRDRSYYALPADGEEGAHRFLVHNLQDGYPVARFRDIFGKDPWEVAPERWQDLEELGVISVADGQVRAHVTSHAEKLICGVFLYSPMIIERMASMWGGEYDPDTDYEGRVRAVCAGCV